MMVRSHITIATFLLAAAILSAEEKSWALRTADVVVVGKLELSSYYLSFDGIHINGSVVPAEILYGPTQAGVRLRYSDVIPCSIMSWIRDEPVRCDYRAVWFFWSSEKKRLTQQGVWLLWLGPEASWRGRGWDTGFRPLASREYSAGILSDRRRPQIPR
jgi:hypothetical protein